MRALAHQRVDGRTVEHDEGVLRQVDAVDLLEELLAHAGICRGLFLGKQLVQGRVAVEVKIECSKVIGRRWELVAGEQAGVIRVVGKIVLKFGDVIPARQGSRWRGGLAVGQEGIKERIVGIVLDVELDADLPKVALDDALHCGALGPAGDRRRVLELQALPALRAHPIRPAHPASVIEHLIGGRQAKHRTGGIRFVARMVGRGMVGAQRRAQPLERVSDDGLLIHRHRHGRAHFRVAGQQRVVKVEVQRLEAVLGGWIDECIVLEALHRLKIRDIQDAPDGIEGARLHLFEREVIEGGEDELVQVGQSLAREVVPGVAHQREVVSWHALRHHERTARYLWVQVLGRLEDLLRAPYC